MKKHFNKNFKPGKPFEGMVKQLKREHLILVAMSKFEDFKKALNEEEIEYDLGDFFGDGIIVVEK